MTINKLRGRLYGIARVLGDVQAALKASRKGSLAPIWRRIARRLAGKAIGRTVMRWF